jgi:GTP cyclohydrolase I
MASTDTELGERVGRHLQSVGLETPMLPSHEIKSSMIQDAVEHYHRGTMEALGLDLTDDSLRDTPDRVAKMYCQEIFTGLDYENFPKCTTVENKMQHDELIIVKDADVLSMCEHHFVPFVGTCSVGYIPTTRVLGLSKIPRIVDFFSRRPQIQERLTAQVHAALTLILGTEDIAVVMRAEHMCMRLRGVKQAGKETITSKMSGRFMTKPELREEFLMLTRKP